MATTRMTERQAAAWLGCIDEANRYRAEAPEELWRWNCVWHDEVRPGRGHDLTATNIDGEYVTQIYLDVYGSGSVCVGRIDWLHNSEDEECECSYCRAERQEDDQ